MKGKRDILSIAKISIEIINPTCTGVIQIECWCKVTTPEGGVFVFSLREEDGVFHVLVDVGNVLRDMGWYCGCTRSD